MWAAANGKLDCLKHLIAKGADVNAADKVSAAPPAAPSPLRPSPSALTARRPCCHALAAVADRVWRRRRASAGRRHGPHAHPNIRRGPARGGGTGRVHAA